VSDLTTVLPMRERVERMERILENVPQVECPTRHKFAPGVYAREVQVPAGTLATGAVHKTEHLTIVVGHCFLTTEEGAKEIIGYDSFVSQPGAKKAIFAIEDTIVTTIHPTDETDVEKLCELLTESKSDELLGGSKNRQFLKNKDAEVLK
jgi:V8-like Glu-specific endopeptidase